MTRRQLSTLRDVQRKQFESDTHHVYLIICKTYILSVAVEPLTSLVPAQRQNQKKKKKREFVSSPILSHMMRKECVGIFTY